MVVIYRSASWRLRILLALVCITASCVSRGPSLPAPSTANAGRILTWIPAYPIGTTAPPATVLAHAPDVGAVGAHPWTYLGQAAEIGRDRPDLMLLAYMNGTFAQAGQGRAFPPSWYLRDAAGHKVRSLLWGNYLMDPTNPAWIEDRVARCRRSLVVSGYGGCLVDMLGTAPIYSWYVTGAPIDPSTDQPWMASSWLAATTALGSAIKAGNQGATVIGNGLGDGGRFFDARSPSEQILNGIDGGIAETWLRTAAASPDAFPAVGSWRRDVDMLDATDRSVFVETKVWTAATPHQVDAWHRFALASFLLANDASDYFAFSSDPHGAITPDRLAASVRIGEPAGSYRQVDGIFERSFTDGIVLVNPTPARVTTDLDGTFRDGGRPVGRSLTVEPHSGLILTAA